MIIILDVGVTAERRHYNTHRREVAKGWTVVRMIMILDVDVTAERRHYNTHRP